MKATHNIFGKPDKLVERPSYSQRKEQDFVFGFAEDIKKQEGGESHDLQS